MSGISGAGKSTYVAQHKSTDAIVCSADDFFVSDGQYKFNPSLLGSAHDQCFTKFSAALKDETVSEVWVDNTNLSMREAERYVKAAEEAGAAFTIIEIHVDQCTASARNVHGLPAEATNRQAIKQKSNKWPPKWPIKKVIQ